ncbi:MAG: translocation/assembly module TamB domain-containing protein [Rubrivivax sp.]|nr:translocation/assembly module TamB domain-containing protein [Rubrivivax sp.]
MTEPTATPPAPVRTGLSLLVPLLSIVSLLLLAIGALLGAAAWMLSSETGSAWLVQRLPGVQVKGFRGALLGTGFGADALRVEWAGGQAWAEVEKLSAEGLVWRWRPHEHAWVALQAARLGAAKVSVHAGPPSKEPLQLPPALRPPLQLDLAEVRVAELLIDGQQPLRSLQLDGLSLDPRPGARHGAGRLAFEGFTLLVEGEAAVANAAPYALQATVRARPLAEGDAPRWAAVARAGGTLADIELTATLRGRPLPGRDAPAVDLRALVRPQDAWPLAALDATTQSLDLAALAAKAPTTRLDGHAVLGGGGQAPLVVDVELHNTAPGPWNAARLPVSRLLVQLRGSLEQPDLVEMSQFDLQLADALRPAGRVQGTAVWKGYDVALEMRLGDVTPHRLDGRAAAMKLSGPLAASITGVPALTPQKDPAPAPGIEWTLDLQGQLDAAPLPVRVAVEGSANDRELKIKSARAQSGTAVAEFTATVAQAPRGDWQLVTEGLLRDFDPLPWWPGDAGSAWRRGPHRANGEWKLDVRLPADADRLPPLTLAQRLAGNGKLRLHDSQLAGVAAEAEATLSYTPGAADSARLRADLSLGGNLLAVEGQGNPGGTGVGDRWRLEAKAESLGRLGPLFQLQPAWARWAPRQGTVVVAVDAEGRWPAMRSDGTARLTQLQAGTLSVARASAQWRVATFGDEAQTLQAEVAGLALEQRRVDNLHMDVRGTLASHRIELSGAMPVLPPAALEDLLGLESQTGTRALIVAQGGWQPEAPAAAPAPGAAGAAPAPFASGRYRARLDRLVVGAWDGASGNAPPTAGWAETRDVAAELSFSEGRLTTLRADAGRLQVGEGLSMRWDEVRLDLRSEQPLIHLRAEIDPFLLAPMLARLQPGTGWGGDLRLAARVDVRAAERMDADIVFERREGDLHIAGPDGTQLLGLSDLRLAVTAHDGVWDFSPTLRGRTIGEISGAVRVQSTPERRWPLPEAPIAGALKLQVADIGIWSAWVPAGWRLAGEVSGTASVSGTFGTPLFDGTLGAQGLAMRNLLQGINFSDGQLALKLEGEYATIQRFTFKGGDGTVAITGGALLSQAPVARLTMKAERFRVLGRVDRQLTTTGTAELEMSGERARLNGRFVLDELRFDASGSAAPSLDEDVAVRRPGEAALQAAEAGAAKARYPWNIDVEIDAGDNARFKGWGLDSALRGQMRVRTNAAGRPDVLGVIQAVDGKFASYGQKLDIERGVVTFTGALGNPTLDVLALRPLIDNTVKVGVTVTGPVQNLRIRLYSAPEMSDNDKLAWLMLGRAPDTLGRNDAALLQRAAVALLSGDGEAPTDSLMKALGIDDVSLKSSDTDVRDTVIAIGKQLSSRWYVGYERGVNATTGTWQLIYRAAQRFTVRMQSGLENALDVIWTWRFQETPADAAMRKSTVFPK